MNIYEKIELIKKELLEANLKKSGENKYAGFKYYELADFLPTIINLCNDHKLFTRISFTREMAILEVRNIEEPSEVVEYTSPMEQLELKGCNKVQALGGTETYLRRYLYQACFDIIENDLFDATSNVEDMTKEEAAELTIGFGKYKGTKMADMLDNDGYITYLLNNSTDEKILKAIELLTGRVKKTEEEWDERLDLTQKLQEVIVGKGLDVEAICEHYHVKTTNELTDEQMKEIIEKRG